MCNLTREVLLFPICFHWFFDLSHCADCFLESDLGSAQRTKYVRIDDCNNSEVEYTSGKVPGHDVRLPGQRHPVDLVSLPLRPSLRRRWLSKCSPRIAHTYQTLGKHESTLDPSNSIQLKGNSVLQIRVRQYTPRF